MTFLGGLCKGLVLSNSGERPFITLSLPRLMNSQEVERTPICHCEPFGNFRINSAKQARDSSDLHEIVTLVCLRRGASRLTMAAWDFLRTRQPLNRSAFAHSIPNVSDCSLLSLSVFQRHISGFVQTGEIAAPPPR